jgi:hypothetical protein
MRNIIKVFTTVFFNYTIIFTNLYAQDTISGVVKSSNGEVIPYVTLTINNKNTLTDLNGRYQFSVKTISSTDTITFSCIGYQSEERVFNRLIKDPNIILNQKSYLLDEVSINIGLKHKVEKWGNTGNNLFDKLLSRVNDQYALFIENPSGKPYLVQSINYYIKEQVGGSYKGPFRVRVYSKSKSNGGPDKDLLIDNIIVRAKRKNSWFKVDISKYQIEMPNDGLYVAMEILPEDSYEIGPSKKTRNNNIKMPCIGLNESMDKSYSWLKNEYSKGNKNWRVLHLPNKPTNFMMNIIVNQL